MKKIENYLEQLATAFAVEFFKQKRMYNLSKGNSYDHNALILKFDSQTPGVRSCINTKCLTIHPTKDTPHHISIGEVWVGFDGEGSPWSDHMGGVDLDCTGLTFQSSIDYIVKKIMVEFPHLLK